MTITVVTSLDAMRAHVRNWQQLRETVGFVPTMGALHAGHLALVSALPAAVTRKVVSIFVNPTQFGPNEDFSRYPRNLEADVAQLEPVGVDVVFAPTTDQFYPPGDATRVSVGGLGDYFCGPLRPGHFAGVATVVTKLFAVVQPQFAAFGQKDFQQLAIIRRLTADLLLSPAIVAVPTQRDPDGVAMSSRNRYLSAVDRERARAIPRALAAAAAAYAAGERRAAALHELALMALDGHVDTIEYVQIAPVSSFVPYQDNDKLAAASVLAIACRIGATRLIDNIELATELDG